MVWSKGLEWEDGSHGFSGLWSIGSQQGRKDSKKGQKGMKIKLMFVLLWLRRFWAITTSNSTAKSCHCFYAKHRAATDQWPVQLLHRSFVSPPHWKRNQSLHFLSFIIIFSSFSVLELLTPSTCWYTACFNILFSYPIPFHHPRGAAALQICSFWSHFSPEDAKIHSGSAEPLTCQTGYLALISMGMFTSFSQLESLLSKLL